MIKLVLKKILKGIYVFPGHRHLKDRKRSI